MKQFSTTAAAVVLGCFLFCPVANAKITRVAVSKDSKIAKELGYTITLTENTEKSGLAGTTSFEIRAPKNPLLQNLSAIVLRTSDGKKLTGKLPLEFQKGKSGEVTCHFQLAPEIAKKSTLELVCPIPGMPNGTIYDVDLATYTQEPSEKEEGNTKCKLDPHGDPLPEHAVMRLGTVRWRPQNGAQCLGISAGSKLIATGHFENLVRIWDARTGNELNHWQSTPTSRGNAAVRVNCFAFSPMGEIVAVGNSAGIIEIRELSTGKQIRRFNRKGASEITALVYSEDGQMLAAGNTDGGIDLWDVAGDKKLRACAGHSGVVGCLTFTSDGKQLVGAGRQDPLIHLWDTRTGIERIAFRGHENGVEQLAFTIDDKNLWSVSSDQTIRRWNVETGKEEQQIKASTKLIHEGIGPSNPVHPAAAFSRDQKVLASLSEEKKIRVWDTATGKEIHALPAESTGVSDLAFSPDGTFIGAVGNDQSLRLWNAKTGRERGPLDGHRDWIGALQYSVDGKQIVSSSWDRTARVWDVVSGKELKQFVHPQPIYDVALSSNSKLVTVGGFRDNTVKLWDIGAGKMLHEWKGEKSYFTSAVFSHDGDSLIAANGIDSVVLWNVANKERVRTFAGPGMRLALSPDGNLLAGTGNDRDWYLWDFETGKQIYKEHQPSGNFGPTGVAFSPDSKKLALGFQNGVSLRDARNGKKLAHFGDKPLHFVAFSPDGKLLATGSDTDKGPHLTLWDVPTEKLIREWKGHVRGVRAIAFSPDGRHLASAGMDTTILIWNVENLVAK